MSTARQKRKDRERRIAAIATAAIALLVGAIIVLSSCEKGPPSRAIVLFEKNDCSTSMINAMPNVDKIMYRVTRDGAGWGSRLLAGSFRGNPSTARDPWPVGREYARRWQDQRPLNAERTDVIAGQSQPGGENGGEPGTKNQNLARERLEVEGHHMASEVAALAECNPDGSIGTSTRLLTVLAQASDALDAIPRSDAERRVVVYTDGGMIGDGIDVRDGDAEQVAAARATFKDQLPRLRAPASGSSGPEVPRRSRAHAAGDPPADGRRHRRRGRDALESFSATEQAYPFQR